MSAKRRLPPRKSSSVSVSQELVQEVMIDQPLTALQDAKAVSKGLFGHQDFVEAKFADGKLGEVPFHLNGQNCATWVTLINRAKSGDIENDRSTGSGISMADLTGPLTASDLMSLQTDVNALQDTVTLKPVRGELAQIENDMRSLERSLSQLRSRGYAIEKSLEGDVTVLASQWERIKTNATVTLNNQTKLLGEQMSVVQKSMADLLGMANNLNAARPLFMQVKSAQASAGGPGRCRRRLGDRPVRPVCRRGRVHGGAPGVGGLDAGCAFYRQLPTAGDGERRGGHRGGLGPPRPGAGERHLVPHRPAFALGRPCGRRIELKLNVPLAQVEGVQKEVDEATGGNFGFPLAAGAPYPSTAWNWPCPSPRPG